MSFSFREYLWENIYARDRGTAAIPDDLTTGEIAISVVLALVCVSVLWLAFRRLFFLASEHARAGRMAALIFAVGMATAWVVGSLDIFGFYGFQSMLALVLLTMLATAVYLTVARGS